MDRIREIEKRYGVDFGETNKMLLATYLRRMGYPSLANFLYKVDKKAKKTVTKRHASCSALVEKVDTESGIGCSDKEPTPL